MNDLLRTRFFILLADTSQEIINTEMQDAYEDFVKQIVTISNSEDLLISSGCSISPVLR